ncbi:MAG: helix-turn-helix transcriptional regulator [Nitrospirae bacterium]|nr:helix-turn-helix transcriptional regulator [Nitrospirota bacterium]
MNDMIDFIFNKIPMGIIVFNEKIEIIFRNRWAERFLKRYKLPGEVTVICRRIFRAIRKSELKKHFPGEIYLYKKLKGSPCRWTFMFHIREMPVQFVCVTIAEESFSNKLELNKIRIQYHLTRRETDVLRRVLKGLKNIEIAEELVVSEQTVKDHLSNVYMKIGVKNRFNLISSLVNCQPDVLPPT